MPITLKQLRYFLVLSEELHFHQAAKRLNISQPPLSTSLKQLEQDIGCQLLDRSSRQVILTPAGKSFAERARRILLELDQAKMLAKETAMGSTGTLQMGFVPSMIMRNVTQLVQQHQTFHPGIQLSVKEANSVHQIAMLERREIDVGFINAEALPDGMDCFSLGKERLVCAVPQNHRLAAKNTLSLTELAGEHVLVFSRDYAVSYHDRIAVLLRKYGIELQLDFEIQSWFTVLALVGQAMGVAVVPSCWRHAHVANVAFIEIAEPDASYDNLCIWREEADNPALDNFISTARSFYRSYQ